MTGNRDQKATRDADYFTEETINYGIDVTFSKDKAKLHNLLIWTVIWTVSPPCHISLLLGFATLTHFQSFCERKKIYCFCLETFNMYVICG